MTALFTNSPLAEAFLAAIPDAALHKRAVNFVPISFVKDAAGKGVAFLLDPASVLEGGAPIAKPAADEKLARDNEELKKICDEDQADRRSEAGKQIDWDAVGPRDVARLARVKELFRTNLLVTAEDYFRAALVLQHGRTPEDYLLAHELAIVAVHKGHQGPSAWLAAATEDRFLQSIGRKQRFGTQISKPINADGEVTDYLRSQIGVPPLAEAEQQAAKVSP